MADVPVVLKSMFRRRRQERPQHRVEHSKHLFWRALLHGGPDDRPDDPLLEEGVVTLEPGLNRKFLQLPSLNARGDAERERAILGIAARYGRLQGDRHHGEQWETVAVWMTKAEEMAEATERRDTGRLDDKHYRQIDRYIGRLETVTGPGERAGSVHISYRARSLFSALWLQWGRDTIPYQGRCVICGAALIGKPRTTCGDYCRKIKSMENQK